MFRAVPRGTSRASELLGRRNIRSQPACAGCGRCSATGLKLRGSSPPVRAIGLLRLRAGSSMSASHQSRRRPAPANYGTGGYGENMAPVAMAKELRSERPRPAGPPEMSEAKAEGGLDDVLPRCTLNAGARARWRANLRPGALSRRDAFESGLFGTLDWAGGVARARERAFARDVVRVLTKKSATGEPRQVV